jgi:uncharacterized protein (DUF3084 family)
LPWLFVLIVIVVAALVAAAGDRMGHRAARRKLRIGKLRPRTVSTIIAVTTGVLISLATFGIVFAVWRDFREALLRYDFVKQENTRLQGENSSLAQEAAGLTSQVNELKQTVTQVQAESKEQLDKASADIAKLDRQKTDIEVQLARKDLDLKEKERLRSRLSAINAD